MPPGAGLLDPLPLGPVTARNRIAFGPHETNLGRGRAISDRHVAYYRRRAEGGCGLVVTEEASVHDSDWPYERAPLAEACGPGWAAVADACHDAGALAVAALGHTGSQGSSAYHQRALWAPSRVPDGATREVPKAMEPADIAAVVAGFAAAAALASASGVDGVEVNAGQHSLLRLFLSGLTNQRQDGYGEDRDRLVVEVLTAVRAAVGPAAAVGLRLSCDELAPWAGLTPDAGAELAARLAPLVDWITVVRGSIFTAAATRPDGHTPPGFNLDLTHQVRTAVAAVAAAVAQRGGHAPAVLAQGSIVDVDMAAEAVASGAADGVEMTRAQIADPDLVAKLAAGTPERVRPCILCNQTCMVRDVRNPIVTCVVEPGAGHETDDAPVAAEGTTARRAEEVLVVGAGVAGLEAARVAALAGHHPRIVTRDATTGGMLRVAAAGAGRGRLALLADWLDAECRRLGVAIETGRALDVGDLDAWEGPVITCTGSVPGRRGYEEEPGATVLEADEVLSGRVPPEGPVLVWDPIGGPVAVSVAELLAGAGRHVALCTPDGIVGTLLSRSGDLAPANVRLQQAGVEIHRRVDLVAVGPDGGTVEDRFSGERRLVPAGSVVHCGARLPDDALWRAAAGAEPGGASTGRVTRAGDAVAPRSAGEAVLEGRRAAQRIGAGAGALAGVR